MSRRDILAGLVGGVLVLGIGLTMPEPVAETRTITSSDRLVTIGGTIRKRDGQWLVWDPNHAHRGLGKVTCVKSGGLTVDLRPVGIAAGFGAVTVDGVLASKGVAVGTCANQRQLKLTLARNGEHISCRDDVFDDSGTNIWITWTQIVG